MPPFTANQQLSEDKLMDIIMFGIPQSWERKMNWQDFDPFQGRIVLRQLVEFCKRIKVTKDHPAMKNSSGNNKKQKTFKGKSVKSKGSTTRQLPTTLASVLFSRSWRTARKKVERRNPRPGQRNPTMQRSSQRRSSMPLWRRQQQGHQESKEGAQRCSQVQERQLGWWQVRHFHQQCGNPWLGKEWCW